MKLKRYKSLLLQVGILLLLISLALFILEQQKKFINIDFSKQYYSNKSIELASFEDGEQWRGNYSYDSLRVLEGKSSLTLSSWYGTSNSILNEEVVRLSQGYSKGYVSIYIFDKKNLSAIDAFKLTIAENEKNTKDYDLTSLLHVGWNRVPLVIPNWKSITKQSFTITSKRGEIAEVNLDRFWIENTSSYTSDVISTTSPSISLRSIGERTYLFSSSPLDETIDFNSPRSISRGSVTISLIPEHSESITLSLNSTHMQLGGKNMTQCNLYSDKSSIVEKTLQTTSAKNDVYVFLKAEVKGSLVTYSVSNNGVDFEQCGEVKSTAKTPIQLGLRGSYLIDSYIVEY